MSCHCHCQVRIVAPVSEAAGLDDSVVGEDEEFETLLEEIEVQLSGIRVSDCA